MVKARMLVEVSVVAKSKEVDELTAREIGPLDAENGLPPTGVRVPLALLRVKAEMSLPPRSAEKRNFPGFSTLAPIRSGFKQTPRTIEESASWS